MTVTNPTSAPDAPAPDLSKATPRPWRAGFYSSVVGLPVMAQPDPAENSVVVLTMVGDREECEANAALIVAAVNTYDPAALRAERDEAQPVAPDISEEEIVESAKIKAQQLLPKSGGTWDLHNVFIQGALYAHRLCGAHPPATSPAAAP